MSHSNEFKIKHGLITYGNITPTASGTLSVGTQDVAFASGVFDYLEAGTTFYAKDANLGTVNIDTGINANWDAAYAHISSDGSSHTFIDQNVTSGASPTFDGDNFTGVDADDVDIADGGGIITATNVEDALQENRTAIDLNSAKDTNVTTNLSLGAIDATTMVVACSDGTDATLIEADTDDAGLLGADKWDEIVASTNHIGADGSSHLFIDQDVTSGSTPTFAGLTVTNAITEFSTDVTLGGDSDSALPTEKAVKTYVDAQIAVEDLWDRSGELLDTSNANDNVRINGTLSLGASGIFENISTKSITASGNITADSLVVDTTTLVANAPGYTDKVGIGTATPSVGNLNIDSGAVATPSIYLQSNAPTIMMNEKDDTSYQALAINFNKFLFQSWTNPTTWRANIVQFDMDAPSNSLVVDSAGDVGIGTATPSANLVVSNAGAEGMEFYKNVGGNSVQIQAYNRSGTAYCNQWYNAATHVFKIAGTTNMTIASGDVYTEAWTDYSATSTVVGWVTPSKVIKYKKIGKLVMVTFSISGTSNSTAANFTLPYAAKTGSDFGGACLYAMDNTAAIPTATAIYMPSASSTVSLYSDMALGTWTASGTKGIKGTFWYEAA